MQQGGHGDPKISQSLATVELQAKPTNKGQEIGGESSGGMEWLGVWTCIFSDSEY